MVLVLQPMFGRPEKEEVDDIDVYCIYPVPNGLFIHFAHVVGLPKRNLTLRLPFHCRAV